MMRTKISSDISIENPSIPLIAWIVENLTLNNPAYVNLIKRGQQASIARCHVQPKIKAFSIKGDSYIVPFGCLNALWPMIREGEWETDFGDSSKTAFASMPCAVLLKDYQERAVEELIDAKGGVLKSGCGSGKTYIGIELLRRLGMRFLWICGQTDLLNQTLGNFHSLYPELDVGTITDGEVHMGKDGTIATVQTMVNIDRRLYEDYFNVVIVDECHHITSNPKTRQMYAKVLGRCKARYKYGLTATPSRQDGLVKLIYANVGMSPRGTFKPSVEVKDSDTQSLRCKYIRFDLSTEDSYDYLMSDGTIDYNSLLEYLSSNEGRTKAICQEVKRLVDEEHRKVALLSCRVEHVDALFEGLSAMGVKCGNVTGKTSKTKRKGVIGSPDSWDVIISTVHLFKEGLDIKALDTVFIALPFKDPIGIQQSEGRSERPLDGKNEPVFIFANDINIPYCSSVEQKMRRVVNRRRS